jgi:outer membrane lipopolysaccharide assembly protein LptE/RlpB
LKLLPVAAVLAPILLSACGYHVAGKTNMLPASVHTIAVVAFGNVSTQYKVADALTKAVNRELIERTHYRITADPSTADAVLTGNVSNFFSGVTTFDPVTNRASGVQATVQMAITLRERTTGKVLFARPNYELHERYEISVDPKLYFDESSVAMDRLARDMARSIVSAFLENF